MANRLADALSPYLIQHRDNPVDWFPWGDEAFSTAVREDKPVFLSIGYSACHWCHVMAHESFEDSEVAQIMNQAFVCVKVDREELPEVDDAYMTFVQLLTGHGGWPTSVFMTPDRRPFFGGTYWPRDGFRSICLQLERAWKERRGDLEDAADQYFPAIQDALTATAESGREGRSGEDLIQGMMEALAQRFDPVHGGFGGAPKFPPHTAIELFLDLTERPDVDAATRRDALEMAVFSLEKIALGGIHDHVGGGFHRYSTDERWLVPHFEKMLYDNALLLANFSTAAKLTGRSVFSQAADGIVSWLQREMTSPDGTFYSALDADSEGEEGKFYVWQWAELLAMERGEEFARSYGCLPKGNFRDEATHRQTGLNILHLSEPGDGQFSGQLRELLRLRSDRVRPGLDDKVLVGWNGLTIFALCVAGRRDLAEPAAAAILRSEQQLGTLPRMIVRGEPSGHAYLEDYAYFAYGLRALGGPREREAKRLIQTMVEKFSDVDHGGFYSTSKGHEVLFGRTKPIFDQPLPSANAIAIRLLDDTDARRHLLAVQGWIARAPHGAEALLTTLVRAGLAAPGEPVSARIGFFDGRRGSVEIQILPGFHINSNAVVEEWLIPTELKFDGATGSPHYPDGTTYENGVDIPFEIEGDVPERFKIVVSYQACTASECLQPKAIELTVG